NSSAEMGLPSALQNEVETICLISLSLPFFSLIFTFFLHTQGRCPHFSQGCGGCFSQTQGLSPQTGQGLGGTYSHSHGFCPHFLQGSSTKGSPSHSGSEKCL